MKYLRDITLIITGALLIGIGFNFFLIPHQLLSGGTSGLSMIISYFYFGNVNLLYFALNLPLLILGWFFVGRRFILLSLLSVVSTTILLGWIPVKSFASDPLLACIFGGTFVGVGAGLSFRAGGSSGGFDILGSILVRFSNFQVGNIVIALNALVVFAVGFLSNDWNVSLQSAISIYLTGSMIDRLFIGNTKVTVYIVTNESEKMIEALFQKFTRGITKIKTEGAYSQIPQETLMTVTTRYELTELKVLIQEIDPHAFVNVTQTVEVLGKFRKIA